MHTFGLAVLKLIILLILKNCSNTYCHAHATKSIKNMATASDVDAAAGGSSAEPEALKHLFSYLVNSIDTAALLPAALERGLITARQRSECYNEVDPYKKAETFLGHLERAVNADCNSFHTFVKILQETRQAHIASRLRG